MDKVTFVKSQLSKLPETVWEENAAKILCPFHDDRNPSLGVALVNIPGKVSVGGFSCWSCFPLATPVWTERGLTPIGDVHVGDKVLTLGGTFNKVERVIEQEKSGDYTELKIAKNYNTVTSTSDHIFFIFREESIRWGRIASGKPAILKNYEEVQAQKIKAGDWVIYPRIKANQLQEKQEIFLDLERFRQYSVGAKKLPSERIDIDRNFAWLLGLYVAEGSNYRGVQLALHRDELSLAKIASRIFLNKFGINCTHNIKKCANSRRVYAPHSQLGKWFDLECGKFARNKKIPDFIFSSPRNIRLAFLAGYFTGDGTKNKTRKTQKSITTISEKLAEQVQALLLSVGYCPGRTRHFIKKHKRFHYTVTWTARNRGLKKSVIFPDYILYQVEEVKTAPQTQIVRDLTIQGDHSFCAHFYAVHNCQEHGGWNKLAAKLGLLTWDKEKQAHDPDNQFLGLHEDQIRMQKQMSKLMYLKPPTEGPWEGTWRGLPGSFLRSIGTETYWDKRAEEYRLFFPLKDINQKLIGHILARGENSDIPNKFKYLNSPACPTSKHWFLLNLETKPDVVVIVEGPYDALRLRYHGIPAICVLGIGQLTDVKIMQIMAKGCRKVILALDADDAGIEALPKYVQMFESYGFDVTHFNLFNYLAPGQEKMDPGDCPEEALMDLKNYLQGLR